MDDSGGMSALERRRAIECRLTPDNALGTIEEATGFLAERGMLTRMPDCALPSLFGACHEEPARAGGRGFDLWPKTRWIWSFQLARLPGVLHTKLHRGKSLHLSMEGARVFDPLVRRAIENAVGDDALLLAHLAEHGASMSADLELEIGWDRKRLKRARDRLERVGAVVSDGLVFDEDSNPYFAPLRRWDQVFVDSGPAGEPLLDVVVAGVRAAVIAPEANVRTWFSWPIPVGTVDQLVASGRLMRPRPGYLAMGRQ
jgi:hypothetical protein